LWMACLYAMDELDIPFEVQDRGGKFFTLFVCKRCRAEWLQAIEKWFHATPVGEDIDANSARDIYGTGVFIRELGMTRELSESEVTERWPNWKKNVDH